MVHRTTNMEVRLRSFTHLARILHLLIARARLVTGTRYSLWGAFVFISNSLSFLSRNRYRRGVPPSSRGRSVSWNRTTSLPVSPRTKTTTAAATEGAAPFWTRTGRSRTAPTATAVAAYTLPGSAVVLAVRAAAQTAVISGATALSNISRRTSSSGS